MVEKDKLLINNLRENNDIKYNNNITNMKKTLISCENKIKQLTDDNNKNNETIKELNNNNNKLEQKMSTQLNNINLLKSEFQIQINNLTAKYKQQMDNLRKDMKESNYKNLLYYYNNINFKKILL